MSSLLWFCDLLLVSSSMGNACISDRREPSADSYGDKLVKYVTIPAVSLLGMISLIVLYLVDKVSCYGNGISGSNFVGPEAEVRCFNNFRLATLQGSKWTEGRQLMHKFFPILLLCQSLSFVVLLILWFWCLSRDLTDQIGSVIHYCDNLTDYYRKYDKGLRKNVTEATLHREIDNCLEFLVCLLMKKAKKLYMLALIKWASLILICFAWFIGYFMIILPDLIVFEDKFVCLYEDVPTSQKTAECTIPTSNFLRAVWYINQVLLGLLALVATFQVIELCQRKNFSSSFFYRTMPGLQDGRLAECVDLYYNPRYVNFLSCVCDTNINLCTDNGLSKSLARKYGAPDGWTPGKQTIVDKHYPVIQPEQIQKFRQSSEDHFRKKDVKNSKTIKTVKVHPVSKKNHEKFW
ncbi:uncharacterized protein [Argopecten irradians]|uniref:uncharacterized protein n=1 Tax=Argopecten irradians TaxID=31199 RepID=UPI003715F6EF